MMMILHSFRVYLTGGFKRPRELTWVTGVLLAVLVRNVFKIRSLNNSLKFD